MTFYIPPVFLFGNKVKHNQEKKKAEYKTATETEIQIENRNIKRIAELEEENKKLKERIDELEKCNLNLQERLDRKEEVNKKLREELSAYDREYFDEDKKASEIYKEYQHSMWFSDFWWYDEDEHIVKDENTYRDLDL